MSKSGDSGANQGHTNSLILVGGPFRNQCFQGISFQASGAPCASGSLEAECFKLQAPVYLQFPISRTDLCTKTILAENRVPGCCILGPECWILGPGSWSLDPILLYRNLFDTIQTPGALSWDNWISCRYKGLGAPESPP